MGDEFASTEDEKNETSIPSEHMLDDLPWRSNHSAFCSYSRSDTFRRNCHVSGVVARQSLLAKLTKDIVKTFGLCNPLFTYSEELNPKRYLTSPSLGVLNDGFDNVNSDLILSVNDALVNAECSLRYLVKDVLGHGTFGQVAKCWSLQRNCFVAVKIIKNQPAYYQQALVEVSILKMLNRNFDRDDQNHIVRIYDYFVHRRHLCISFELLDTNLYELIKANNFRGLSLSIVQVFSKQILLALAVMRDAGIIHCDLKPENILLCPNGNPSKIKVIDFGSACMENRTVYSYIQSRYYRSPEVVLGYQYTSAIDMWSFGCIVAELFLGLPLFPDASEFDLMSRMAKILGAQPPDHVLRDAKNTGKYFKCTGAVHFSDNGNPSVMIGRSAFEILKEEEYESRERKRPLIGKEYFSYMDLKAIVSNYPYRKNLSEEDKAKESHARLALIDFLRGLVDFDPSKRWSPVQASRHPFITGDHFTCPYVPLPDISRTVSQSMKINHNPGDGHWFAAGLSPNMMVLNHHRPRSGSLFTHSNSPNYVGDVSNNSYGENSHAFSYFSPAAGSNVFHAPPIGSSPDTRHRYLHRPNRHGVGISPPSSSGNFNHMPLGTSPSQFTPPNYTAHFSTSPARGGSSSYGSPLGKISRHRGNSSNCDEMQQPPSVLHNHVSTLPEISTWQHHTHLDNSDDTADWDPNFSDLLLHEDCIELGGLSSDLGRQMHLGPSVWSGGMGLYGHLARHLRHEETAGTSALPPPFSVDSGYGRHVSRHLQFPTQGSLSRLGQQRSDRHGGPAGARDWWQPAPPPGQATHAWINYAGGGGGGLRSPKNSALRKGFSWGGKPNQVPTSGRSKEWGTIA